ncbi:MAG: histidine phosphatase family protein [Gammaproteobacteria bacterium]
MLRHGQPEGGEILRGRLDHPLAEAGWQQMWLATGHPSGPVSDSETNDSENFPWDEIVTSPLQRCRQFAEKLAARTGLPVSVEPAWREIDYGEWEGLPLPEWRRLAAAQFQAFRHDPAALHPPGGESFTGFRDRILDAWSCLLQRSEGRRILLITHGGVMRVILPTVLGMPLNRTGVLEIPFACLSRVAVSGTQDQRQARLLGHNISSPAPVAAIALPSDNGPEIPGSPGNH